MRQMLPQGVIRKLQTELANMETTLSSTAHDKKAAQMENAQLTTQLEQSQKVAYTAQSAREAIAQELTGAEAQANELRRVISRVEDERDAMKDIVNERDQVRQQLRRPAVPCDPRALAHCPNCMASMRDAALNMCSQSMRKTLARC